MKSSRARFAAAASLAALISLAACDDSSKQASNAPADPKPATLSGNQQQPGLPMDMTPAPQPAAGHDPVASSSGLGGCMKDKYHFSVPIYGKIVFKNDIPEALADQLGEELQATFKALDAKLEGHLGNMTRDTFSAAVLNGRTPLAVLTQFPVEVAMAQDELNVKVKGLLPDNTSNVILELQEQRATVSDSPTFDCAQN